MTEDVTLLQLMIQARDGKIAELEKVAELMADKLDIYYCCRGVLVKAECPHDNCKDCTIEYYTEKAKEK